MTEKQKVLQWIKDHKKQLIAAGIGIAAIIAIIIGIKNKAMLQSAWESLKATIAPTKAAPKSRALHGIPKETVRSVKAVASPGYNIDKVPLTSDTIQAATSAPMHAVGPSVPTAYDIEKIPFDVR